jgi:hypothetical protein
VNTHNDCTGVKVPVTITGVAFFDKLHGQTGVAPNGIELHPVLSITISGSSKQLRAANATAWAIERAVQRELAELELAASHPARRFDSDVLHNLQASLRL